MDWTIGAFILGTLAVASVGWWSAGRYLARVLAGTESGRGTAQRRRQPDQVQTQLRAPAGGWPPGVHLTVYERWILRSLTDAWNQWCQLPDRDADDGKRMVDAIHEAQDVLALRVARRADPDVWRQPSRRQGKTADAAASARDGDVQPRPGSNLTSNMSTPMPATPPPFTPGSATALALADKMEQLRAGTLGDPLAEVRDAGFAHDLEALLNSGQLAIAGALDSPGSMRLEPAAPSAAAPAPAAKPSLTARDKMMITLTLMAVGPGHANGFLEAPCSWSTGDGKTVRGTRESMFAAMAATAPPPAAVGGVLPAEMDLTGRELWLMTQAYLAGKGPSSPRSVGEWLSEKTTVIEPHRREPIRAPRRVALALRAARTFGGPGRAKAAR